MGKYKVLEIKQYDPTRDIKLRNLNTGTADMCFDDSIFANGKYGKWFSFLEVGHVYDCKIMLIGELVQEGFPKGVRCQIIQDDIMCGDSCLVSVSIGQDIYYLPRWQVEAYLRKGHFYFSVSRKDLIQVNNTVHGDCLKPHE